MSKNIFYLDVGKEANRSTAESTTIGTIPLSGPVIPTFNPDDKLIKRTKGSEASLGDDLVIRMQTSWTATWPIQLYTEAGTTVGMMGTLLRHLTGYASSNQNGTTGQYYHMGYPVADPFVSGNLGTEGITFNVNANEGATVKNWPYVGGRIKSAELVIEPANICMLNLETFGTNKDASASQIASPVFPAENLRLDYNKAYLYTGTITKTGTPPDYTDFSFGSATQIKPDKIVVKMNSPKEDKLRISNLTYADETILNGVYDGSIQITLSLDDPASGFSSSDEYQNWILGTGITNFFIFLDTGTQAGTGDNHSFYFDFPRCRRAGGSPDISLEKDPVITLTYNFEYDATDKYPWAFMLKNTASSI